MGWLGRVGWCWGVGVGAGEGGRVGSQRSVVKQSAVGDDQDSG